MTFDELSVFWDEQFLRWQAGAPLDPLLQKFRHLYKGSGPREIDDDAMPEPWIGDVGSNPEVVTMGLNPGMVNSAAQHRGGLWPSQISKQFGGSYTAWAASGPYSSTAWEGLTGKRNRYSAERLRFVRAWTGREVSPTESVKFEIFPWHSAKWGKFTPDTGLLNELVFEPIASTGVRWCFGFGKSWWEFLESSGIEIIDQLGVGGRPFPTAVSHRRWLVGRHHNGMRVAVMRLKSYPTIPTASEITALRAFLD